MSLIVPYNFSSELLRVIPRQLMDQMINGHSDMDMTAHIS